MFKGFLLVILLFSFSNFVVRSQDSTFAALQPDLLERYSAALDMNIRLYNGPEYPYYPFKIHEGHPYFDTSVFIRGSIRYDGIPYTDVWLLYDLVKDEIVVRHHKNYSSIRVQKNRVDEFSMHNHTFVNLNPNDSANAPINSGFYERVYNGKTKAYARRVKVFQEQASGTDILKVVYPRSFYYILIHGKYHQVRTEGQLLDIFKTDKREVQQHLRKNKIRFRNDRERAIKEAVSFYDQLKK